MKNFSKALVAILGIIIALQYCQAQEPEFGVTALSGPDGVLLLVGRDILSKNTAAQNKGWVGYNIYKKDEGKANFKKLNSKIIARVNSLAELEAELGDEINLLLGITKITDRKELWQMIENRDEKILVLAMLDPALRKALGLSYVDKNVTKGKKYIYAAVRVDDRGKESAYSDTSWAIYGTPPFELKGPLDLKGKASDNQVRLQWQVNPEDSGSFSFSVYRAFKAEGPFVRLNNKPLMIFYVDENDELPKGAFIDTTARNGRLYYYSVVSVDIAGNESPKKPLLSFNPKDDTPPVVPQNVVAKSTGKSISVTWKIEPEIDLAGFYIYRSLIPDSLFVRINDALSPPDSGYWDDKSALPSTQYYYRVTSIDKSGNESGQSATALSILENRRAPLAPNVINAESTADGVKINWQANTESDLLGYYVFRSDGITDTVVQISPLIGKDTTFFYDKGAHLSPKGAYSYQVKAINYTGVKSGFSAPVIASPGTTIRPEPPLSFYGYQDVIGNRLFWTPTQDNVVAGYSIYRKIETDSLDWQRLVLAPLPKNTNNYTDSSAALSVAYLYQIRSIDGHGIEGKPSHSITLNRFVSPPLPPSNVLISKTENGLKIVWDPTMEPRVKGYRIYRRSGKDGASVLNQELLPKASYEYRDITAKPGFRYFYSISSVGEDGREGAHSDEVTYYVR